MKNTPNPTRDAFLQMAALRKKTPTTDANGRIINHRAYFEETMSGSAAKRATKAK